MKRKLKIILILLGFIIPYILIFRAFFTSSPLVWGDAPYFYPDNLKELFQKPLIWDFRNDNFGNPQFQVLWLYIPTFLFGLFNKLFGLNSEILIRLIFYFPATVLSIVSSWFFIKNYTKNLAAVFLGSLLYSFNTYFLLLLDGGQIGVALAYGIFPFSVLALQKLNENFNIKNLTLAISIFFMIENIDLRLAILSPVILIVIDFCQMLFTKNWKKIIKNLANLFLVLLITLLLNAFWLLPLLNYIKDSYSGISATGENSGSFLSLLNGFLLFNPHFPDNEFGKVLPPPFYFGLLPILIFGGLLFKNGKKKLYLALVLLIFIFFVKGETDPFGTIFRWLIDNLPLGVAFRDATKFFIPSLLISSVLLASTFDQLVSLFKKRTKLIFLIFYLYLMLLIWPAFFSQLTGVLAIKDFNPDYKKIYQKLSNEAPFFRTVWFSERPPLAFSTMGKEAISANLLYGELPFASMILGSYDKFYFLHDPNLTDWFKLLGIKYAFFPQTERKKSYNPKELTERKIFEGFINQIPQFEKLDWGVNFPIFKVSNPNPKIFVQDKALIVLGDFSIIEYLKKNVANFSLSNQGMIFLEDGKVNPNQLLDLPKDATILVSKDRNKKDLTMVFLQNYFTNLGISKSEWGSFTPPEYLDSKYELLKNGITSNDLLFNKGIYFSSIIGERIDFKPNIKVAGRYYLIIRSISNSDHGLKISLNGFEKIVNHKKFAWDVLGPFSLQKEDTVKLENLGGFQGVNIVSVVPTEQLQNAEKNAEILMTNFENINLEEKTNFAVDSKLTKVNYIEKNPTEYEISLTDKQPQWIIFSDHFNQGWHINGSGPIPFYSMINGFWVNGNKTNLRLYFIPQNDVNKGLQISAVAVIILAISLVVIYKKLR